MKKSFSFVGMVSSCLLLISLCSLGSFAQSGTKWSVNGNTVTPPDNKIGSNNTEPIVFITDGVARIKLKSNGDILFKSFDNLGIGYVKFDNDGKLIPVPFNAGINQVLTGNGSFQDISLIAGWHKVGADMVNTNPGNVGIGTNSPLERFHVEGNALVNGFIITQGISIIGHAQGEHIASDTMRTSIMMMDTLSKIEGETRIIGSASVSDKMGIGTKYPTEALEIVGNSKINGNSSVSGSFSSNAISANNVFLPSVQKQQLLTTDLTGKITTVSAEDRSIFQHD